MRKPCTNLFNDITGNKVVLLKQLNLYIGEDVLKASPRQL